MGRIKIEVQHVGGEIDYGFSGRKGEYQSLDDKQAEVTTNILNEIHRTQTVALSDKNDEIKIIPTSDIMRIIVKKVEDEKPAKIEVKQA